MYITMKITNLMETNTNLSSDFFYDPKKYEANRIKILGVGSSMREKSYSTQALKILLDAAKKYEAETLLLDLNKTKLPMYNPDETESNDYNTRKIKDIVNWADAFVLGSPDYHGSISGSMKNFLDHYFEEFAGKTFGYICASHEKGLTVMDQMRTAVRQCYGWSMPYGVSVNGEQDFDAKGQIRNSRLSQRLEMLARDLVIYGRLIRAQFNCDLISTESNTFAAHYRE
jgi:NAD(P)H-dependent FMN reductase